MSIMAYSGYPTRGIYPSAHPRIVPAVTEISRGAGAPGINAYCRQPGGIGLHKTGEAADFQAGGAPQAWNIHNSIATYGLNNWSRLKVRYIAWNGWEYINGPTRKRKQVKNYGGTDPFHKRHTHIDFLPGNIPGAVPGIAVGGGMVKNPSPTSSAKYYTRDIDGKPGYYTYMALQRFLADRGFYSRAIDGSAGAHTWTAYQNFLKFLNYYPGTPLGYMDKTSARGTQQWLTKSGHYKGRVTANWDNATWRALQTFLTYAHAGTKVYVNTDGQPKPPPPADQKYPADKAPAGKKDTVFMALTDKQQRQIHTQTMNISAATNRSEQREREMLTVLAQQNQLLLNILNELTS